MTRSFPLIRNLHDQLTSHTKAEQGAGANRWGFVPKVRHINTSITRRFDAHPRPSGRLSLIVRTIKMKAPQTLTLIAVILAVSLSDSRAKEPYVESYLETKNPVRIYDWDTLKLLLSTKVSKVKIDADSPEKLVTQLEGAVRAVKGADKLRFSFKRELWEQPLSDGTTGTLRVSVHVELEDDDLLTLILYVSELNLMTFSVKKGEIVFRPLIG
jgi:hypothetical protein